MEDRMDSSSESVRLEKGRVGNVSLFFHLQ